MAAAPDRLLVVSIFGPSERNAAWYDLQRRFLANTTDLPYDYRVILNGVSPEGFRPGDVAIANPGNVGHGPALTQALEICRRDRHAAYLLLDSDAFPVMPGWYGTLTANLARFDKLFAAPVRAEQLDLFPHPCAVFLLDALLDDPRLEFREDAVSRNLLGIDVLDTVCGAADLNDVLFPLMRTNVVNVHPIAAAIYHHLFYHHGAGSRRFVFSVMNRFAYHRHWWPAESPAVAGDRLFQELVREPEAFVARLMGGMPPRQPGD